MKKITFLLITLAFAITVKAQSQSSSQYSLGFKLLSIEETTKILNEVRNTSNYSKAFGNGVVFKVNDNQISYKFQVYTYKDADYSFENTCTNCEIVNGEYKSLDIKMGFERSLTYSKLQPFYGMDLGFKKVNFKGSSRDYSSNSFLYHTNVEKNGGLVYPFVGVKYTMWKYLTLSAEAGANFYYNSAKEVKSTETNTLISQNSFLRWEFTTRPLGLLSIEFNFGEN